MACEEKKRLANAWLLDPEEMIANPVVPVISLMTWWI